MRRLLGRRGGIECSPRGLQLALEALLVAEVEEGMQSAHARGLGE
jgi:hypothetical protein